MPARRNFSLPLDGTNGGTSRGPIGRNKVTGVTPAHTQRVRDRRHSLIPGGAGRQRSECRRREFGPLCLRHAPRAGSVNILVGTTVRTIPHRRLPLRLPLSQTRRRLPLQLCLGLHTPRLGPLQLGRRFGLHTGPLHLSRATQLSLTGVAPLPGLPLSRPFRRLNLQTASLSLGDDPRLTLGKFRLVLAGLPLKFRGLFRLPAAKFRRLFRGLFRGEAATFRRLFRVPAATFRRLFRGLCRLDGGPLSLRTGEFNVGENHFRKHQNSHGRQTREELRRTRNNDARC